MSGGQLAVKPATRAESFLGHLQEAKRRSRESNVARKPSKPIEKAGKFMEIIEFPTETHDFRSAFPSSTSIRSRLPKTWTRTLPWPPSQTARGRPWPSWQPPW